MRLRFPELKNAANVLKSLLDDEFLESKWGDSFDKSHHLSSSISTKKPINPSIKLIQTHQAYSPFIDYSEKISSKKPLYLDQFIRNIFHDASLRDTVDLNELIAQLFLGLKKLHEKNLVLRNIQLNTISVTKNSFGCYHLKYNLDMLMLADEKNLSAKGISASDYVPHELFIYKNQNGYSHESITINDSLYRTTNKFSLDSYALGQVLDILRLAFKEKSPNLTKLISTLTTDKPETSQSIQLYFYDYFKPNPVFYLNMITRKFADSQINLSNDAFLISLNNLKKTYHMTTNLVDFINLLDNKNHPSAINYIFQKTIELKNHITSSKKNEFKLSMDVNKAIEKIEQLTDKIIVYYKNITIFELSQFIFNHLSRNYSEQMIYQLQRFFYHPENSENIRKHLLNLFNDNMIKKLSYFLNTTELIAILMIMKVNIEKYVNNHGVLTPSNVINTIQINFILAYKLHIDAVIKMEFWSKLFTVKIQRLKELERDFLNAMNHELIHDPFFSTYETRILDQNTKSVSKTPT